MQNLPQRILKEVHGINNSIITQSNRLRIDLHYTRVTQFRPPKTNLQLYPQIFGAE